MTTGQMQMLEVLLHNQQLQLQQVFLQMMAQTTQYLSTPLSTADPATQRSYLSGALNCSS